ncbi:uncharacterized protein LOC127876549 isoform X4 [Dreissena polymorpha]|uniref:uncharacterized protein LOC127876549 isoform X4 n=1 Tax=Dreissena polymorpha TaxID=45954 RepID=UPI0022646D24|nr:uncharacterized protein LOC127876549 isoform X4 [Dreissena polymorpha]
MAEVPLRMQVEQDGTVPFTCSLIHTQDESVPNRTESKNENLDLLNKLAVEEESNQNMKIIITEKTTEITMLKTKSEKLQRECEKLENELSKCKTRLSKIMGNKLTDNNPAIADLSDSNRPAKLAEQFSNIYEMCKEESQKQTSMLWRIAYMDIDSVIGLGRHDELTIPKDHKSDPTKHWTCETARVYDNVPVIKTGQSPNHLEINKQIKEFRKYVAQISLDNLFQKIYHQLTHFGQAIHHPKMELYIRGCVNICWLMNIQEPPVAFTPKPEQFDQFSTELYRSYTQSGPAIAYLVWPTMLLHKGGPLLLKGITQWCTKADMPMAMKKKEQHDKQCNNVQSKADSISSNKRSQQDGDFGVMNQRENAMQLTNAKERRAQPVNYQLEQVSNDENSITSTFPMTLACMSQANHPTIEPEHIKVDIQPKTDKTSAIELRMDRSPYIGGTGSHAERTRVGNAIDSSASINVDSSTSLDDILKNAVFDPEQVKNVGNNVEETVYKISQSVSSLVKKYQQQENEQSKQKKHHAKI